MRAVYHVRYRNWSNGEEKGIDVVASNKADAYEVATYEAIPELEGFCPYSAWVESVTYNNGNHHLFNTSEGNAY